MTRPFVWFLTGLIMLGVASTASAAAQDEVAQVIATRVQAFNEGNLEAFMSTVAQDSAVTPPASPFRIEGKDAISAYYAGLFQAFPTRRFVPRQRSIRVYGTTAVSNSYYTLTSVDRAGKVTTTHGRINVTFVKMGDRWLAVDQHASVVPSSP